MKRKLLAWGDSIFAKTGFGRVSKEILTRLTKDWDVTLVGINHFDLKAKHPDIHVIPARVDGGSPYGEDHVFKLYKEGDFDACFILNDIDVTYLLLQRFLQAKHYREVANKPPIPIIYYFPIDGPVIDHLDFLKVADVNVTFTKWGRDIIQGCLPEQPVTVIPHGVDTTTFCELSPEERVQYRKAIYNVYDDRTVLISVNRNSKRKDLFQLMQACHTLKKEGSPTLLYLHAKIREDDLDLVQMSRCLGLEYGKDILFPDDTLLDCSDSVLNKMYNGADVVVSSARKGGWELSNYEGACAGLPVVCPDYGPFHENMQGWGYLFPISSYVWTPGDFRGYGYFSHPADISRHVRQAIRGLKKGTASKKIKAGREWASRHTWDVIHPRWEEIFNGIR